MTKIDGLTMGAIAFAGFAAWYVLRNRSAAATTTGNRNTDTLYALMGSQRQAVGNATGMNLSSMGGALGLQGPISGFWS